MAGEEGECKATPKFLDCKQPSKGITHCSLWDWMVWAQILFISPAVSLWASSGDSPSTCLHRAVADIEFECARPCAQSLARVLCKPV